MNKILTIDQAFNDSNFDILEAAIRELNERGLFDSTFVRDTQSFVTSEDSTLNWTELRFTRLFEKPTTI